jgi:hypothetical protein
MEPHLRFLIQPSHQCVYFDVQVDHRGNSLAHGIEHWLVVFYYVGVRSELITIAALFDGGKSCPGHDSSCDTIKRFNNGSHGRL